MPLTWGQVSVAFRNATYTFAEISVALELFLIGGYAAGRKREGLYNKFFEQNPKKKKKTVHLIMKIKGQEIKQGVNIPDQVDVTLKDIDLIISEVLNIKPEVAIDVT
mgnify:CR=1 FL=1|jgi:hypothetical protein|tara:strand:+ start:1144 stop:1464 length:321 start_codon:yes stop_codon:yes gene_type:complete